VVNVWQELNIENHRMCLAGKSNAKEVMRYILSLDEEKQVLIAMLLWLWWHERNKIREGDRRREAMVLAYIVQKQASEMLAEAPKIQSTQLSKHWRRPPSGVLKLNTDGSFFPSTGCGGWGFVIRDENAEIILAGAGSCQHLLNPLHAELLACVRGLEAAANLGGAARDTRNRLSAGEVSTGDKHLCFGGDRWYCV